MPVCAADCRSPPPDSRRPSSLLRSALSAPPVIVRGVGHAEDEQSLPLVRGADFPRREQSSLNLETQAE